MRYSFPSFKNFNSRPHGGRLHLQVHCVVFRCISTHALTEGDQTARQQYAERQEFQLTPSRRATRHSSRCHTGGFYFNSRPHGGRLNRDRRTIHHLISTHALTEGDPAARTLPVSSRHFNSRPHGGRPFNFSRFREFIYFNSRPHGGRHIFPDLASSPGHISTHALTEGDLTMENVINLGDDFNSRPHGGRHIG